MSALSNVVNCVTLSGTRHKKDKDAHTKHLAAFFFQQALMYYYKTLHYCFSKLFLLWSAWYFRLIQLICCFIIFTFCVFWINYNNTIITVPIAGVSPHHFKCEPKTESTGVKNSIEHIHAGYVESEVKHLLVTSIHIPHALHVCWQIWQFHLLLIRSQHFQRC